MFWVEISSKVVVVFQSVSTAGFGGGEEASQGIAGQQERILRGCACSRSHWQRRLKKFLCRRSSNWTQRRRKVKWKVDVDVVGCSKKEMLKF